MKLAHEISGIALAKWYNTLGVTAFVLIHRFPQSPDVIESYKAPLQDGQRALRYIRAHAEEYGIDIHKVGVMGCSAGGHLATSLCAIDEDWSKVGDALDAYSCKPSFAVLISPVISMDDAIVHKGAGQICWESGNRISLSETCFLWKNKWMVTRHRLSCFMLLMPRLFLL